MGGHGSKEERKSGKRGSFCGEKIHERRRERMAKKERSEEGRGIHWARIGRSFLLAVVQLSDDSWVRCKQTGRPEERQGVSQKCQLPRRVASSLEREVSKLTH